MPHDDHVTPSHQTEHHGHDTKGHHGNGKLYENDDVPVSALVKALAILVAFIVFSAIAGFVILLIMTPDVNIGKADVQTQEETRVRKQLPGPRLQANPVAEIQDNRATEAAQLNSYGRDPKTGQIHIPIDVAIDKVVDELPTRAGAKEIDIKTTTAPNTPPDLQGQ